MNVADDNQSDAQAWAAEREAMIAVVQRHGVRDPSTGRGLARRFDGWLRGGRA